MKDNESNALSERNTIMNYFVIHSGCDYEQVKCLIESWSSSHYKSKFSVLKSTQEDWHDNARAKIRSAHKVIYVVGATSGSNKNIDWELNKAVEENKEIYVYKLDKNYALNSVLNQKEPAANVQKGTLDGEVIYSQNKSKFYLIDDENIDQMLSEDERYIADNLDAPLKNNLDVALKQYEMFVATSEELVRRKQSVNNFYISINSLIVSIILAAFAFLEEITTLSFPSPYLTAFVICISSLLGGIVCYSWISLLQSYADLNSSKMQIISYIETQLAYNLYDTEWEVLSNKVGKRKYKSFSKKEMFIAKLFFLLYALLFALGIYLIFSPQVSEIISNLLKS